MFRIKKIIVWFLNFYQLDLRALSLMRIGLAIVILADLLIRGSDLTAHYTDEGMWPTKLIHNFGWKPGFWSLHELSGSYAWALFLFIIHFCFALLLMIGYRTKLVTLFVWLLYISLHNRNLYIQQAGDDLIRLTLFWGLFLPWNAYYSIDSRSFYFEPKKRFFANTGYLLLIASVYFFTVNLKDSTEWHSDHSAIYYALSLEQLRLPGFGDWLYQHPKFMEALTAFVYYVELIIPILILFPGKKGYLRFTAFILLIILHAGIGLTLYVGLFFIINIVTAIGLIPEKIMDKLESKISLLRLELSALKIKTPRWRPGLKILTNSMAVLAIILCLLINLGSLKWFPYELKSEITYPVNVFRLDQFWGMFSPSILKKDGWFVYDGRDSLGRQWDLRLNQDYVDHTKPERIVSMYKTDRWRKLAENMQRDDFTFLRPLYCNYILKKWNREHPGKNIKMLFLYYMTKESLPDYKTTPYQKNLFSVCDGH